MARKLRLSLDAARNDADLWKKRVYFHVAQFGKCLAFFAAWFGFFISLGSGNPGLHSREENLLLYTLLTTESQTDRKN